MELNFFPTNLSLQDQSRPDQDLVKTESLNAQRIAQSESKETELKLTTKEGDVVTLSSSSAFDSEFTTYSAFKKTSDSMTSLAGFSQSLEYKSSYEITLEGDFSKEELRDINKAIKKLEKAMKQLSRGNIGNALNKAASITNLDTVAGFEASLTYNASSQYQYVERSTFEQTDTETLPSETAIPDSTKSILEQLTDELAETAKETEIPKEEVVSPVDRLFEDMKARMEEMNNKRENPFKDFLSDLKNRFHERLFN